MPYFKVLGGRWGEGWKPGDIIQLDTLAAIVRLRDGEIEEVSDGITREKLDGLMETIHGGILPTQNEIKPKRGRPKKV